MSNPSDYGERYWCIKSSLPIGDDNIYVWGNRIEITSNGDLIVYGQHIKKMLTMLI